MEKVIEQQSPKERYDAEIEAINENIKNNKSDKQQEEDQLNEDTEDMLDLMEEQDKKLDKNLGSISESIPGKKIITREEFDSKKKEDEILNKLIGIKLQKYSTKQNEIIEKILIQYKNKTLEDSKLIHYVKEKIELFKESEEINAKGAKFNLQLLKELKEAGDNATKIQGVMEYIDTKIINSEIDNHKIGQ